VPGSGGAAGEKAGPDPRGNGLQMGAPNALVGVIIAGIVLLPEGLAALRARARIACRPVSNLALGSALASIGLTIPAVSFVSLYMKSHLRLG